MVANYIQNSLYVVVDDSGNANPINDDFAEYDTLFKKQKKKRVHYKRPTYHKSYKNDIVCRESDTFLKDDIATWGKMQQVYTELANFFPFFISTEDDYKDFGKFRVHIDVYDTFKTITCEIIGTENMYIDDRLYIHLKVLNMLKANISMETINKVIKDFLNGSNFLEQN